MSPRLLLASLLLTAFGIAQAQETAPAAATENGAGLSSKLDFADPASRDAPIQCKAGDIERQAGKSLGQLFGADWPAAPEGAQLVDARSTVPGHMVYPRGLEGQHALIVVAVLVGTDGKVLRAEPLCATATGFDKAAKRAAVSASYAPATADGKAIVQPLVVVLKFNGARKAGAATAN